ncbi:MAG: hypothetical protein AB7F50_09450 [Fimbriimonadaceae bacterium]
MKQSRLLATFASLAALTTIGLGQDNVYGVSFNGNFYRISNTAGVGTLVGSTFMSNLNNLFVWHGSIYTFASTGRLFRIDPSTAQVSAGTLYDFGGKSDVRAACSDAREEIWAVVDGGASAQDELWRVPAVGNAVFVGLMGRSTIQGLVVTFDDRMFAWDVDSAGGLVSVDRLTGATTDVSGVNGATADIQELYSFGTTVRGIRNATFLVDSTSGATNQIGTGGYSDIRGASMMNFFMKPSATVKFGQLIGGNDLSLTRDDGESYDVQKFLVPNQLVDPITVEFKAQLPSHLSMSDIDKTRVSFDCQMNSAGAFQFSLDALNRVTGRFDVVLTSAIGTASLRNSVSRFANTHVGTDGAAVWRVRVKPVGPVANALFTLKTDYFGMDFVLAD